MHAQSLDKMEYVWFPLLHPKLPESEFGHLFAMGAPEADYASWQADRVRRIERGTPKSDDDVIVDYVLRCPVSNTFNIAYTTHMSGWSDEVHEARLSMLSARERKVVVCTVQAPKDFLFTNTLELREFVAERLGKVQLSSGTEITFLTDSTTNGGLSASPQQLQDPDAQTEELVTVQIRGAREDVNAARTQLLVLLDQCAGFDCDRFEGVTLLQQYATAGPNFTNIFEIMCKTSTKIYFSSPLDIHNKLPSNALPAWESRTEKTDNALYITGLRPNIENAKTMLLEFANLRIISSTVTLSSRKLEWILLTQSEFVHSVMCRCGVFIAFPPLGSLNNFATIYGTEINLVFKALRDIASLACEFHEIFLSILPVTAQNACNNNSCSSASNVYSNSCFAVSSFPGSGINVSKGRGNQPQSVQSSGQSPTSVMPASASTIPEGGPPAPLNNLDSLLSELGQISESTGAEIIFSGNMVAIYGPNSVVSPALTSVINCNYFQRYRNTVLVETEIRVELAQKHEEFLKGKHCGKIKKLIHGSRVRYFFEESLTESNVVIRVHSPVRYETASAYHNLSLELPIEMSMYVPETEHHKMIGERGRNSQRLSTKYHSFLRFSSKAEQTEIGGYFKLSHNVFALTPAKFSNGFENLLTDLVQLYRQVCTVPSITVSLTGPSGHSGPNSAGSSYNSANEGENVKSSNSTASIAISNGPASRFARSSSRFGPLNPSSSGDLKTFSSSSNSISSNDSVGSNVASSNGSAGSENNSLLSLANNSSSAGASSTVASTIPIKSAQTICEVMFPHRFLHFLLPCVSEIENNHSVRIKLLNCEFGSDLIQLFGTHVAIHEAIAEIAARCAPQSICIETGISPNFVEARFAAGVDILVDHLLEKFNVMLAVSLAPTKGTVMFRLTSAPQFSESLAPCCMMTIEYFSDQITLPRYDSEDSLSVSENNESLKTITDDTFATADASVELTSPSKSLSGKVGSPSKAAERLTPGSENSPDSKNVNGVNDTPKSVRSTGSNSSTVSAAEASFQYFDARVYSGVLPTLGPKSPTARGKANMLTPEGTETENDKKSESPSTKKIGVDSPSSEQQSRKVTTDSAESTHGTIYHVPKRSGSITVRDLWNAFQKTPDSGRLVPSLAALGADSYDLISPATAAELPFFIGSSSSLANGTAQNGATGYMPPTFPSLSTSKSSRKPVGLSIVKPGDSGAELFSKSGGLCDEYPDSASIPVKANSAGVSMTTTGINTDSGENAAGSAVDDIEIHRGMPKKRRMSLLSPTPASRTSPPARLQPPRKVNLENVGEKDDNLESLQIRELTSNMRRASLAPEQPLQTTDA